MRLKRHKRAISSRSETKAASRVDNAINHRTLVREPSRETRACASRAARQGSSFGVDSLISFLPDKSSLTCLSSASSSRRLLFCVVSAPIERVFVLLFVRSLASLSTRLDTKIPGGRRRFFFRFCIVTLKTCFDEHDPFSRLFALLA
jgi:hypothetical protein